MKKKVLLFKHPFTKIHGQKSATLLHVSVHRHDQLNLKAVELDTAYLVTEMKPGVTAGDEAMPVSKEKYFDLPKTTLLRLVFIGDLGIPFTTYRKYNQNKWAKYEDEIRDNMDPNKPTTIREIVVEDTNAQG